MSIIMKCSYCSEEADFKCASKKIFMCTLHLEELLKVNQEFSYKKMDIILDGLRFNRLKSDISKIIKELNKAKYLITLKTISIMSSIKSLYGEAIKRITDESNYFLNFLNLTKFCVSDLPNIEKYESFNASLKNLDIENLKNELEHYYAQDFILFSKKYWETDFLENHSLGFSSGDIAVDGQIFVTAGYDKIIRVWDLVSKKQKFLLHGHHKGVTSIKLTGDSKNILSGSTDNTVRIWSIEQQAQITILKGHKSGIKAINYLDEQELIFSGDSKNEVIIWDFNKHTILRKISLPTYFYCFALMTKSKILIVGLYKELALTKIKLNP